MSDMSDVLPIMMAMMMMKKKKKSSSGSGDIKDVLTTIIRQVNMQFQQMMQQQQQQTANLLKTVLEQQQAILREMAKIKDEANRVQLSRLQERVEELTNYIGQSLQQVVNKNPLKELTQSVDLLTQLMDKLKLTRMTDTQGGMPFDKDTFKMMLEYWTEQERRRLEELKIKARQKLTEEQMKDSERLFSLAKSALEKIMKEFIRPLGEAYGTRLKAETLMRMAKEIEGYGELRSKIIDTLASELGVSRQEIEARMQEEGITEDELIQRIQMLQQQPATETQEKTQQGEIIDESQLEAKEKKKTGFLLDEYTGGEK